MTSRVQSYILFLHGGTTQFSLFSQYKPQLIGSYRISREHILTVAVDFTIIKIFSLSVYLVGYAVIHMA